MLNRLEAYKFGRHQIIHKYTTQNVGIPTRVHSKHTRYKQVLSI